MSDTRIANLLLVARRAAVSIDDDQPHFDDVLHPVVSSPSRPACRFTTASGPSPNGPVSQELRRDLVTYREQPDHYLAVTLGRGLA